MRYILALSLAIFIHTGPLYASGKIIIGGTDYLSASTKRGIAPSVGLSIYEPVLGSKRVALNTWMGWGRVFRGMEDFDWVSAHTYLEMNFKRLSVGMGYKGQLNLDTDTIDHGVAARMSYRLWD